jgi:hypothetical protein
MDNVPEAARCTCTPKVVREEKEYPPKMGEGVKLQESEAGAEHDAVGVKEGGGAAWE